jgi:cardiolipin synthase
MAIEGSPPPPGALRSGVRAGSVPDPQAMRPVRQVGTQALSRASGAPLVPGNKVRVLKDADGNYPVWLDAIRAARRVVYLENYIFEEDEVGNAFADALCDRARDGVRVRVIRDWLGSLGGASRSFWRRMADAGVHLRCFNPPRLDSPFGWISRDHRKMIAVDGEVAFVSGLCISKRWRGDPARKVPPWRDTGIEISGPAVADVEQAFAGMWESMGEPIPDGELSRPDERLAVGEVALRVVAGVPSTAGLLRMDQLVAAVARRTLWLADAYFVGITSYVQALRAAASDGVDVRLLVPNATDIPLIRTLSRSGYRSLLEAGVRIFEWNGSMMHAKTAVADGRWTRIGSTNLNMASFLGNYELDVAIEDEGVAGEMQHMFERDMENATEISLTHNRVVRVAGDGTPLPPRLRGRVGSAVRSGRGRGSRAAASAIRVANTVGAAVMSHREIGQAEARLLIASGLVLVALAVLATIWPRLMAVPLTAVALWIGVTLLWRARRLMRAHASPAVETKADAGPVASAREAEPPR